MTYIGPTLLHSDRQSPTVAHLTGPRTVTDLLQTCHSPYSPACSGFLLKLRKLRFNCIFADNSIFLKVT